MFTTGSLIDLVRDEDLELPDHVNKREFLLDNREQLFRTSTERTDLKQAGYSDLAKDILERDLKETCEKLLVDLLGNDVEFRWNSDYFPFTHPSFELEVKKGFKKGRF